MTTRSAALALFAVAAIALLAIGPVSRLAANDADPTAAPDTQPKPIQADADASYTLGYVIAHRLAEAGIEVDAKSLREGFLDAHEQDTPRLSVEQMRVALESIQAPQLAPPRRDHALNPAERATTTPPAGDAPNAYYQADPFSLRIDGQIPGQRIDTAVPTTRRNTFEADTEVRQ
ncbi:MAG: FKBP-type peptidyl-prolyl cis-trans isomerase N-terminal domain-containing protein [Planctomycetota bacterium]